MIEMPELLPGFKLEKEIYQNRFRSINGEIFQLPNRPNNLETFYRRYISSRYHKRVKRSEIPQAETLQEYISQWITKIKELESQQLKINGKICKNEQDYCRENGVNYNTFRKYKTKGYSTEEAIDAAQQVNRQIRETVNYNDETYSTFKEFTRAFGIPYERAIVKRQQGKSLTEIIQDGLKIKSKQVNLLLQTKCL